MSGVEANVTINAVLMKRKVGRPMTVDFASQGSEYYRVGFCRRNVMVQCECGFSVKKYSMKDHVKTNKHLYMTFLKNAEKGPLGTFDPPQEV